MRLKEVSWVGPRQKVLVPALPIHILMNDITSARESMEIHESRISISGDNGYTIHKFKLDSYITPKILIY